MIAEWGASLRRAILQVFHEAPIPTVHRRGRRQEVDHRLCTPIFRLPRYQSADSVKTEVKHAFEKQFVVGLVEVDLAAVKGTIEGRVDVCPRSGLHLGRQKDHEDPFRSRRRFLDGNAHGNPTDLRPAIRQVLNDGADALGLLRLVVPSEAASPHVELASHRGIGRRTGTPHAHSLVSGLRMIRDPDVRVDRAFQDAPVAVDVDDERAKVVQEEG